ncbi:hypothetical protein BDN67DRAFT_985786 [Paxillus ammoniavirescens]|nr:hypothetical protein BDN67DRAFT_985786 [Paxillus ammoniavirescens]
MYFGGQLWHPSIFADGVVHWVFKGETATPHMKGEGASLMVTDFVFADHGWLRSPDGKTQGRVLFRCGKTWAGYFTNIDIQNNVKNVMAILDEHYHDEDHILVFDNATTHPKWHTKERGNWGVEVNQGSADGKVCKIKVPMSDRRFDDGTMQPFYFPPNDPCGSEWIFKGMAVILEECKCKDPSKFTVPTTKGRGQG